MHKPVKYHSPACVVGCSVATVVVDTMSSTVVNIISPGWLNTKSNYSAVIVYLMNTPKTLDFQIVSYNDMNMCMHKVFKFLSPAGVDAMLSMVVNSISPG